MLGCKLQQYHCDQVLGSGCQLRPAVRTGSGRRHRQGLKSGFLSLGTADVLAGEFFAAGSCPVHYVMLNDIPGPCPITRSQ